MCEKNIIGTDMKHFSVLLLLPNVRIYGEPIFTIQPTVLLKVLEPGGSTGPKQGRNTEQRKGAGKEICKYCESVPS